jgi:two-component system, NtrC family, response regulator HydG
MERERHRLCVIELAVRPLRERRDDILPLARMLLASAARRTKSKVTSFTPTAVEQLQRAAWRERARARERDRMLAAITATA